VGQYQRRSPARDGHARGATPHGRRAGAHHSDLRWQASGRRRARSNPDPLEEPEESVVLSAQRPELDRLRLALRSRLHVARPADRTQAVIRSIPPRGPVLIVAMVAGCQSSPKAPVTPQSTEPVSTVGTATAPPVDPAELDSMIRRAVAD